MALIILTIIVAISLFVQYILYKNPYKIIQLRNKFSFRKNLGVFNQNLQTKLLEDVDLLSRRYKAKMTVTTVVYLLIMATQLFK